MPELRAGVTGRGDHHLSCPRAAGMTPSDAAEWLQLYTDGGAATGFLAFFTTDGGRAGGKAAAVLVPTRRGLGETGP